MSYSWNSAPSILAATSCATLLTGACADIARPFSPAGTTSSFSVRLCSICCDLASCALVDSAVAAVGEDVVRSDADGLDPFSDWPASLIAGGGVLPRIPALRPPLADGDRDIEVPDGTFAVVVLESDDSSPVLSMPDTTDGTYTALPNSSSEIASIGASSRLPNSSTVGRATTRSRLSESPNFAVEPDDAPESVIAPATTR